MFRFTCSGRNAGCSSLMGLNGPTLMLLACLESVTKGSSPPSEWTWLMPLEILPPSVWSMSLGWGVARWRRRGEEDIVSSGSTSLGRTLLIFCPQSLEPKTINDIIVVIQEELFVCFILHCSDVTKNARGKMERLSGNLATML